ncbi:MAG TPA: exodeoxyribonuclease VII small subunit [Cyclobacteriaceae bacterium]
MAKSNKFKYTEAVREIEEILNEIEAGELEVDILAERVRRAGELIKLCREKLRKTEEDLEENLNEEEFD